MSPQASAGARFRVALTEESPLQVMGAITAYAGLMAKRTGSMALYLSGGGVAANSLGMPDLGISTMEDVLTDARRERPLREGEHEDEPEIDDEDRRGEGQ